MPVVYLNGAYLPSDEASISVDDRGFLFADGVYEVTAAYRGRLFRMDRHIERMRQGLAELAIDYDLGGFEEMHERLIRENGLEAEETSIVYVQVTRGAAPRSHAFPTPAATPTVYAYAKAFARPSAERWESGYSAVTVPDRRWARVDIKTIALLPNVLAQQAAIDAGVDDAIFVKDGVAIEGAHSNLFAVFDGTVVTYPKSHLILPGITRGFVLELCDSLGIPVELRAVSVEELGRADEVFFSGTTTEVKPTVEIDGRPVGTGAVGPVARRLQEAFVGHVLPPS